MYSRVTLLEIDTMRIGIDDAVTLFRSGVLPGLRDQNGYEGCLVLATPEGKGMIVTLWASAEDAAASAGFASEVLSEHVTLFRSPAGREHYEVALADLEAVPAP